MLRNKSKYILGGLSELQRGPMLLRDFIDTSLYDPIHGYFCSSTNPVGFLEKPIDFNGLSGSTEYYHTVAEKYDGLRKHWLTPSEIFTPHIGSCIANYIVREWKESSIEERPLEIIEIGAGTGTLARDILNWIKEHDRNIYEKCTYVSIEISKNLASLQHRRVCVDGGHSDERFSIRVGNACNPSTWEGLKGQAPFIVAMEVFDNLPHDKVAYTVGRDGKAEWMESLVSIARDGNMGQPEEHSRPVQDSLIKRALDTWLCLQSLSSPKTEEKILGALEWLLETTRIPDPIFLPTSALQLFDTIHTAVPRHSLVASDFDQLPDVKVAGRNAPLVSSIIDGRSRDHGTIYVPLGSADIFFPSDFNLLQVLYAQSAREKNSMYQEDHLLTGVAKAKEYLSAYLPQEDIVTTQSGFNPLLEDYSNTSFLLSRTG